VFTDRVEHPTTKIQLLQEERRQWMRLSGRPWNCRLCS
jgi:hypothetical protein